MRLMLQLSLVHQPFVGAAMPQTVEFYQLIANAVNFVRAGGPQADILAVMRSGFDDTDVAEITREVEAILDSLRTQNEHLTRAVMVISGTPNVKLTIRKQ